MVFSQMDYGGPHENGTIHLVPIANPQPAGGIVVSSANVKSEPQNPQTSVHVQMPNVQYIQEPGGVSVSSTCTSAACIAACIAACTVAV